MMKVGTINFNKFQTDNHSYFDDIEEGSYVVEGAQKGVNVNEQDSIAVDFGLGLEDTVIRNFSLDGRSVGLCDGGMLNLNEYLFQLWRCKSELSGVENKDGFFARNIEDYILMLLTIVDFNKYRDYVVARNFCIVRETMDLDWGIRGDRTCYDRIGMLEFETSRGDLSMRISDSVEFVARHLFDGGYKSTYGAILDSLVDDTAINQYDPIFLTDCFSKGLGRLSDKMVGYNQDQTLQAVERLFSNAWADVLKTGVLVDWGLLFEKYVEWKKDLGFFSFKKFLRRMGVLRKLRIDEQTKAVKEVFPWIKADEIKSRRLSHPSLIRVVKYDSDGATFDLHSYDYDGYYARDNQQGPVGVDVGFVEEIARRADFDNDVSLEYLTTKRKQRTVRRKPGRPRKLNIKNVTGASAFNVDRYDLLEQNAMNRLLFKNGVVEGLLEKLEAIDDSFELF